MSALTGLGELSDGGPAAQTTTQGRQWEISSGDQRAVVAQRGAALRTYRVADQVVVTDVGDDEIPSAYHGAVLAPWPNRIRSGRWSWRGQTHQAAISEPRTDTALHGLLAWVPWQLVHADAARVALQATVLPQPGYPFHLDVSVAWSVSADGLRCDLGALNTGTVDAPFGVATHPYFAVAGTSVDDLRLTLAAQSWQRTDERLLPTTLEPVADTPMDFRTGGDLRGIAMDTAFTDLVPSASPGSTATLSNGRRAVTVWADADFRWWQVYTSDYFPSESPLYRTAVALEAMTCGPDAFNTGRDVIVLAPGEPWSASWGARLSEVP